MQINHLVYGSMRNIKYIAVLRPGWLWLQIERSSQIQMLQRVEDHMPSSTR
jgi:hypothetical protein